MWQFRGQGTIQGLVHEKHGGKEIFLPPVQSESEEEEVEEEEQEAEKRVNYTKRRHITCFVNICACKV